MEETILSSLERLTELQKELGYKEGNISPIALFGLVGESGEVLAETVLMNFKSFKNLNKEVEHSISIAKCMDEYKKEIRRQKSSPSENLVFIDGEKFNAELADCFYYLNILAMNRGLTIDDLAKMAYDKIKSKQAAGGSSEDRK